jgi:hypothetical protein
VTNWSDFAPRIREELGQFLKKTDPRQENLRRLASDKGLLPVLIDWSAFVGLAPDGQMFWVQYDPPHETTLLTDGFFLPLALMAKEYPSLAAAGPQRTAESKVCKTCGGSGVLMIAGRTDPSLECGCGGLGWLPG